MTSAVILGAQWGDEGKGKVVDYYAKDADIVVRYQGGCNAGHTVVVNEEKYKFHLIPSGVVQGKKVMIGNEVVDLKALSEEIETLKSKGINPDLLISERAHITLPYHKILDGIEESYRGKSKVGTTKRGIGPTYTDKVARSGIRMIDLLYEDDYLEEKIEELVSLKNKTLKHVYGSNLTVSKREMIDYLKKYGNKLKAYIGDVSLALYEAMKEGKNILFEGAQGTFLDVDHGTYPFVTSSNPTIGGVFTGTGIGPKGIKTIIGVSKAYTTRVGGGPFPTELKDEIGERIREKGGEFGTTTGRPRRCGWLDAVMLKYATRINSLDGFAITKLDVLGGLKKVKICVAYEYEGKRIEESPADLKVLEKCKPVYEEFDGWKDLSREDWMKIAKEGFDALPEEAKDYLRRIEELTEVPIFLISVGPERGATISLKEIFKE